MTQATDITSAARTGPTLLSPIALRGARLRNRIVVSPMCQYRALDSIASEWHLVHLGRFALGGAGMVMTEATAVEPRGRITHGDLGIWSDEQGTALARIAAFLKENGAVPAIQLAHAGRKASMQRPWFGNGPLGAEDFARGDRPWPIVAPSAVPLAPGWLEPQALEIGELRSLVSAWVDAAKRAVQAGFEAVEIHSAHGYLLHQFLSPISNRRGDAYGGDRSGRMRFPLDVVDAVRRALPPSVALFVRVSAVDGIEGGWALEDTVAYAIALRERGVDVVDCSSGGIASGSSSALPVPRRRGFQLPFAAEVRRRAGVASMAVGLIIEAQQAEAALAAGDADLIAIGRELLRNPNWSLLATNELLGDAGYGHWPPCWGWWLERRRIEP
ncbi:MAG: NADH:flavin oxidoreductase/NADH oxidase [Betaproteobacteria bacterium]|nr:NADH:flavin oxidoreductase/NADH oxidase [Betaproteobacteria bacterium]